MHPPQRRPPPTYVIPKAQDTIYENAEDPQPVTGAGAKEVERQKEEVKNETDALIQSTPFPPLPQEHKPQATRNAKGSGRAAGSTPQCLGIRNHHRKANKAKFKPVPPTTRQSEKKGRLVGQWYQNQGRRDVRNVVLRDGHPHSAMDLGGGNNIQIEPRIRCLRASQSPSILSSCCSTPPLALHSNFTLPNSTLSLLKRRSILSPPK